MSRKTKLPTIPDVPTGLPQGTHHFLTAVRDWLRLAAGLGTDKTAKIVSGADLASAGLVTLDATGSVVTDPAVPLGVTSADLQAHREEPTPHYAVKGAGVALAGHKLVVVDAGGNAIYADPGTPDHAARIYGMTLQSAALGNPVLLIRSGEVEDPGWTFTAGSMLFLGASGSVTQTPPSNGFVCPVGFALSATKIVLALSPALATHMADTVDAHDASTISYTPTGNIAATDVQAALNELDSEKVSKAGGDSIYGSITFDSAVPTIFFRSTQNSVLYQGAINLNALVLGLTAPSIIRFANSTAGYGVSLKVNDGATDRNVLHDGVHNSTGDPHTQYVLESTVGQPNGVATLDSVGKIPTAQLPALALTSIFTVASEAAQLALVAQEGDVAIRADINKSYAHNGGTAGTMADWSELLTPTDLVLSVFGRVGAITAQNGDYTASQVTNVPAGNIAATTVQAAINELDTDLASHLADTVGAHAASAISLSDAGGHYAATDVEAALAEAFNRDGFLGTLGAMYSALNTGEDGAVALSTTQALASNIYLCTSLNISAGVTVSCSDTTGFLIFICAGTATIAGTLTLDGKGAAGALGGGGLSAGSHAANGTDGKTGAGGGGGGGAYGWGGNGGAGFGAGSAGGGYGGGDGYDALAAVFSTLGYRKRLIAERIGADWIGAGGGAGGGQDAGRGNGGAGGGVVIVLAKELIFTGTVSANGANGANSTYSYSGGGGGGGGGTALLGAETITTNTGTLSVAGGTGGTATGTGGTGGTGAAGLGKVMTLGTKF